MDKHVPVLLNEVLKELDEKINTSESLQVLDCTLGQAGHSIEIFKKIRKGVLISIDLDINTIEWVANEYGLQEEIILDTTIYTTGDEYPDKRWYVLKCDFAQIEKIKTIFTITCFDLILADLGYSNYQLLQNKGISFSYARQRLDMRYDQDTSGQISASEILNTFSKNELAKILEELGQIENPKNLVDDIVNKRKFQTLEKVEDILSIVSKKKYPPNYKIKLFQALRSFVNKEPERLQNLLQNLPINLNKEGIGLVITFNSLEEQTAQHILPEAKKIEPNIQEIISNPQSRSAKLYIYKKE